MRGLILLFIVFALGFAAGAWLGIGQRADTFAAGVERRLAEDARATPAPAVDTGRAFSTDDEMLTAVMSAVAEEEPLLRAHRLQGALGHLSSAKLAALFARAVRVEDRERRDALLSTLLTRWSALDPTGATAAVRPYLRYRSSNGPYGLEAAVCMAWAHAQPEAALAERDPARRFDALARLPAGRTRSMFVAEAIRKLSETDCAAAESHLDLLSDPLGRERLRVELLGKLAERDPAAALARLAAGKSSLGLASAVLRAAAKRDPAAALATLDAVPEELRSRATGAALVGWAEKEPRAALEWAVAHGIKVSEALCVDGAASAKMLITTALANDRAETVAWLLAQPVSRERDALLRAAVWYGTTQQRLDAYAEMTPAGRPHAAGELVEAIYRESSEHATAWVSDLPASSERAAAVRGLVEVQAKNAPERADTLASAWPADRDAALAGLAAGLTEKAQPLRAAEFARQIGASDARERAIERVMISWRYSDPSAARAWLASAAETSPEQKRVLLRKIDER